MLKSLSILAVLSLTLSLLLAYDAHSYLRAPIAAKKTQFEVEIERGASLTRISQQLHMAGVITQPLYFQLWARIKKQTSQLKPGEYIFNETYTPRRILDAIVAGQVKKYQITIVEGKRLQDFLAGLQAHPKITQTVTDLEQLKTKLNIPQQHLEGLFFPDTYTFAAGTTDIELLRQSYQLMQTHLASTWQTRSSEVHLKTPYEALILASIVEKETSLASERARIAGVFLARLTKGMRLQTDPTVIYGLGDEFDGNLQRKHLRQDNPYNTYVRHGLPPSPIALVSKAALAAVMQPEITGELYFVAKQDGSHYFSKTYREHTEAVRKYQLN